ncbi:hypothetical protein [Botrimarina mediterranea]|uniref:hypothetical protein n=1 Tax=Botrimarina mediterranea TaxID=2528022 RepID=UPI00118947F6|nr:hypothetical protein K2D_29950 [Planctomycetes bacterium K2D]
MKTLQMQGMVCRHIGKKKFKTGSDGKWLRDQRGEYVPEKIKGEDGIERERIDYKVAVGIGYGVAAVEFFIDEDKARELAEKSGCGFKKGERFDEYPCILELKPAVKQRANGKYIDSDITMRLVDIRVAKAA